MDYHERFFVDPGKTLKLKDVDTSRKNWPRAERRF